MVAVSFTRPCFFMSMMGRGSVNHHHDQDILITSKFYVVFFLKNVASKDECSLLSLFIRLERFFLDSLENKVANSANEASQIILNPVTRVSSNYKKDKLHPLSPLFKWKRPENVFRFAALLSGLLFNGIVD